MKPIIKFALILFLCVSYSVKENTVQSQGNPVIRNKFIGDPATLVHGNAIYLYATEDLPGSMAGNSESKNCLVYSSTDLKTWKEYSMPLSLGTFEWASEDDQLWASHVVEKDGKFYWYVTISSFSQRSRFIGVAVSDSPIGPFKDALGKPLVSPDLIRDFGKWGDVDPCVFIDENDQAYIFWGGGRCYYAKLKGNMIELEGTPRPLDLPMYFAGPWVHKNKRKYYLSYEHSTNPQMIGYAVSDHIDGPWEYAGIINYNDKNSMYYQSAIEKFKGKWYFFYHKAILQSDGSLKRSVCIEKLDYYDDGMIKRVKMTDGGVH
jgi:beta-xylosidase